MTSPGPCSTRRAAAFVATLVTLLLVLAAPAHAGPGTSVPGTGAPGSTVPRTPTTTPATPTTPTTPSSSDPAVAPARLRLLHQTPFVAPTDTLVLTLDPSALPADATLTLELYGSVTAANGRNGIDETLQGKVVSPVLARFRNVPLAFLPANPTGGVDLPLTIVPADPQPELGFRLPEAGVFPLVVTVNGPGGPLEDAGFTTYVNRVPDQARSDRPVLDVATLLPFAAPPALTAGGATDLDATAAARLSDLTRTVTARPDVPLTLAPVPETLDALDSRSPDPVDDLRGSLRGRQVLNSPYVTLDANAWMTSRLEDEFRHQLNVGAEQLVARLGSTPLPDRRTWPAAPTTTAATFSALATFGIDRTILPESMLLPLDPKTFPTTLAQPFEIEDADGGRLRAVMDDLRLTGRFGASDDPALAAQVLLADLATIWFESPTTARGVVVAVPVDDARAIAALGMVLDGLAWQPPAGAGGTALVQATTVDTLFELQPATTPSRAGSGAGGGEPLVRAYNPTPAAPGRQSMGDYPERLDAAQLSVDGYRSMVATTAPERVVPLQRLLDVSGAASFDAAQRQAYLDSSTARVEAEVRGVTLPSETEGITLAATEAEIPVVIENALDYPVAVRVSFASEKLDFRDGATSVTVLQPGTNKLAVPVRTRASGKFPVDVRLSSPDGNISIDATRFEVRSTAISGIGLVISIGAGIFLALWWARHWRDGRRAAKLVAAGTPPPSDDGGAGGAAPGSPPPTPPEPPDPTVPGDGDPRLVDAT